jgi:hypothetical protein
VGDSAYIVSQSAIMSCDDSHAWGIDFTYVQVQALGSTKTIGDTFSHYPRYIICHYMHRVAEQPWPYLQKD